MNHQSHVLIQAPEFWGAILTWSLGFFGWVLNLRGFASTQIITTRDIAARATSLIAMNK